MTNIGDAAGGRDNNFNLLRMIAAMAVLVEHAFPLTGHDAPIVAGQLGLGNGAVYSFFVISGFFIAQSFERRHNLVDFIAARVLRLYPGLIVAMLLTALVLGPLLTTLPPARYFTDPSVWTYALRNLPPALRGDTLPGLFDGNPYGNSVNGSLWTLSYEITCYAGVAVVGLIGLSATPRRFALAVPLYALLYAALKIAGAHFQPSSPAMGTRLTLLAELSLPFFIGMCAYQLRARIPLHAGLAAASVIVLAAMSFTPWLMQAFALFGGYVLFWLGFRRVPGLGAYNRLGDYSYGTYIYAYPLEQAMVAAWKGIGPGGVIAFAVPATLLCALASWHLVEHRALRLRPLVTGRRTPVPVSRP